MFYPDRDNKPMVDKDDKKAEFGLQLAPRIKAAIRESSRTQEAIAEELGVSKAAVSKWVRLGRIELHHLYGLAIATSKPPEWFFPQYKNSKESQSGGTLESLLNERLDDSEFLESALLTVLKAKQRAARRS